MTHSAYTKIQDLKINLQSKDYLALKFRNANTTEYLFFNLRFVN